MTDEIDIDGLENGDDLKTVLSIMQDRLNDLDARVKTLQRTRGDLVDRLEGEITSIDARVSDIAGHIELVDASLNTAQKGKVEKIMAILDYAETQATGGPGGKSLDTGEVTAASGASRDTALRLMDELAGRFDWIAVENPGGPNPKRIMVQTSALDADARRTAVRQAYAEGDA